MSVACLAHFYTKIFLGMDAIVHAYRCILIEITSQLEQHNIGSDQIDYAKFRLEWFTSVLLRYNQARNGRMLRNIPSTIIENLQTVLNIVNRLDINISHGYRAGKIYSGYRGRPSFDISKERLELFLDYNFSIRKISEMLGASISTINRRLSIYGLSISQTYSTLTDGELDAATLQLISQYPNCGYRRMIGLLRGIGINVGLQQSRVRESMRRSDPEGILIRALQLTPISRRTYNVSSPLALWHLDGNHKLIRYFFTQTDSI